jgi:propanediol dehydratase large subunit
MIKRGAKMQDGKMVTVTESRKYSYRVYKVLTEYWHMEFNDHAMDIIDTFSKEQVLGDFLAWEGIIGYDTAIMSIVNA